MVRLQNISQLIEELSISNQEDFRNNLTLTEFVLLFQLKSKSVAQIPISICLLLLAVFLLVCYGYLLLRMQRSVLMQNFFYKLLLLYGLHECTLLLLFCIFLITCILAYCNLRIPNWFMIVESLMIELLKKLSIFMILVCAILRMLPVFKPLSGWDLLASRLLFLVFTIAYVFCMLCEVLALEFISCYIADQLLPLKCFQPLSPKLEFWGRRARELEFLQVLLVVIFYLATAVKLGIRRRKQLRKINVASQPTAVSASARLQYKSEKNLLILCVFLFLMYVLSFVTFLQVATFNGSLTVCSVHLTMAILNAGLNPFVYIKFSSQMREVVPVPKFLLLALDISRLQSGPNPATVIVNPHLPRRSKVPRGGQLQTIYHE